MSQWGCKKCLNDTKCPVCGDCPECRERAESSRIAELKAENAKLKREVEVLRLYGNKDCTAMADEALNNEEESDG